MTELVQPAYQTSLLFCLFLYDFPLLLRLAMRAFTLA